MLVRHPSMLLMGHQMARGGTFSQTHHISLVRCKGRRNRPHLAISLVLGALYIALLQDGDQA